MTTVAEIDDGHSNAAAAAKRIVLFVNLAHALDHFVLLIYPTAVIALARESSLDYGALISLSTGAFVAFGLFSLPVGFIANRAGRRNMIAIYFFGIAFACAGMATAASNSAFAIWLFILGVFAAIYHPVGSAMIVANAPANRLGRTLGVNGVWGNLGAASAPIVTGSLAYEFGWRAGFVGPAIVSAIAGLAFLLLVPDGDAGSAGRRTAKAEGLPRGHLYLLAAAFAAAVASGGATFNILSVALPKVIDERLGLPLPLQLIGSLATIIFIFGALTQLNVGRIVERQPLPRLLTIISVFQPLGFLIASVSTGVPLLIGLLFTVAAIYGNVVVVDAMVARYIPDEWRSRAFGMRYFLGFAASGFAVPLIGWTHNIGGFPLVLAIGGFFGLCLFASALLIWRIMGRGGGELLSAHLSESIAR